MSKRFGPPRLKGLTQEKGHSSFCHFDYDLIPNESFCVDSGILYCILCITSRLRHFVRPRPVKTIASTVLEMKPPLQLSPEGRSKNNHACNGVMKCLIVLIHVNHQMLFFAGQVFVLQSVCVQSTKLGITSWSR